MSTDPKNQSVNKVHPALSRALWPRVAAYLLGSLLIIMCLPPEQASLKWIVLLIGCLYPVLFHHIGIWSKHTRLVGFAGYYLDAVLWALAVVATNYSIVVLAVAPQLAVISGVLMLGPRRGMLSFVGLVTVLLIGAYFVDIQLVDNFYMAQAIYAWILILAFMFYVTMLVNGTTRSFVAARHQLQEKNLQITDQAKQLESIGEVAQLVNSTLDIDEVMNTIMARLNRVFDFSIMAILFLDQEKQTLCLDRIRGDIPDEILAVLQGMHIPMSEQYSAFTMAVTNRQPRYLADVAPDRGAAEGVTGDIYKMVPAKSILTFPLITDDEAKGVLAFANVEAHFHLDEADIDHIEHYVTYIVSALRNASDYREIQESRAAANAANKAKSQFLANMSHELRTPMNAVIGYSEMLEEEVEDQGLDDLIPDLQKIRSAGHHLLRLINDVLDLSKIEADKIELYPQTIQLNALLVDIEATAKPLMSNNNNRFEHHQVNDIGEGFLDETKLRQVVLNLLSNAAKFTSDGLVSLSAERYRQGEKDWFVVKVRDSGIGMTEEQLKRVFDPFLQADASTTREYGGTGLGLSISQKFCEMMGGSLTAESEKNVGSTFIIRLPAGTENQPSDEHPGKGSPVDGMATNSACVLVIDDDEHVQDLMQRLLSREGYRVVSATSGEQGIKLAREIKPDVITLDVLMPGQDGWSVLSQLKSDPDLVDIPVVMQSILDEPSKAFMLGASDYLTKPLERSRISEVIRRLKNQNNRRALVVEDDASTLALFAEWLTSDGWQVHTAENGLDGLQSFLKHEPGLVILDLMMPEMDGFEFMDQIRNQPTAASTSVIVVTAKDLTASDLERLNGGVQRIIQKGDHKIDSILGEIRRYLS